MTPLSPMPFVIVTVAFSVLMEREKQSRMIIGFSIGNVAHEGTHLQFADDTIIFL